MPTRFGFVIAAGILVISEPASERLCDLMEIRSGDLSPCFSSDGVCHSLAQNFPPHSHDDSHPDEPTTVTVISASGDGVNVAASIESFSVHAVRETKREIFGAPITSTMLAKVYVLSALKIWNEFPSLSDPQARGVFQSFQLDAMLTKVRARFIGDVDLSAAAVILGLKHPRRFYPT